REQLSRRIIDGQVHVDQSINERIEAQKQLDFLKNKRAQLKTDLPDLNELSQLKSWFDKREHFQQSIQNNDYKLHDLHLQIGGVGNSVREQLRSPLLSGVNSGSFPDYHSVEVKHLREQLRRDQEEIRKN